MKKFNLLFLLFLTACQAEIPAKVEHEGTIRTENVITIQINIPDNIIASFDQVCKDECGSNTECTKTCKAEQQANYTNTLLGFLSQLQTTLNPPPSPSNGTN
jgi:hypothetical protein